MKVGLGSSSMADDDDELTVPPPSFDASTPRFLPYLSPPPSVKWNTRNVLESTFSFFFPTLTLTWIPFLLVSRREEGRKKVSRKKGIGVLE